ncbi:STAS domain-containing protein [bacterium]|nr:STAS domain-containing protein [bacterium]
MHDNIKKYKSGDYIVEISMKNFGVSGLYVKAKGNLDFETAIEYGTTIKDAIDDIEELILDFEEISYVSSVGLRILLELYKQMKEQGSMKLKNVSDEIMNLFQMTGFNKFLTVE